MASRYWVGGTAAWDGTAGTKWALTSGGAGGQAVPTSADDVFFTNLSTGTCTISTGNTGAKSIDCTGHTGTIAGTAAISVAGSVTLVAGQTFTYSGTLTLTATGTLTTGGKTIGPVTVDTVGGTVTLGGALTSSGAVTITNGTFTTSASNYAVTATILSSSNANTRTITLNGSTVTLSGFGTPLDFTTATGLTFTAGTSSIVCTGGIAYFSGGGKTFNNVSLTNIAVSDGQIRGANTFAQLTLTAPTVSGISPYSFDSNQTITTLVASGASAVRRIFLYSNTPGTRRTLTVTTWSSILDVDFRDIGMNTSRSGTRLGDCGNNNNVTFVAAKTVYWNLTGSQSWSSTGWATTSGGTPAVNNFPLAQDTAVFDNTGAATTVDINASFNIGSVNMSARTSAMTMTGASAPSLYGDWTTGSGVTLSFSNVVRFAKTGTQTLTSAGKSFYGINIGGPSSLVLADALVTTVTGAQSLFVLGSIDAVSYSVTSDFFTGNGNVATALGTGTWTITGVLSGTGPWTQSATATVTGSAEIILSNTTTGARTFAGGGKTYGKLTIGGTTGTSTLTITGANTFTEIASTKTVAHTIVFPNATTTTGAFTVQGSSGNVVTLSRTGASGTFTLAKSGGGVVSSNYLSISNSAATPSTLTWYAGANSTDGGGNTGWIFANAPVGNFFLFF
jgi:hypothetical protein